MSKQNNNNFQNSNRLYFEKYTDNELNLILRDLASNENLNVKQLFSNYLEKAASEKKQSTKLEKMKRDNLAAKQKATEDRDSERLEYYSDLKTIKENALDDCKQFQTRFGKDRYKMKLLKLAYKSNNVSLMTNLYLQLLSNSYANEKEEKLMKKVTKIMDDMDIKRFQFEHLSNELAPLDFYNSYEKTLDSWQIDVIENINEGISTLVCAPTSCGKTWLSLYPGINGKKVLFIAPTTPLVLQVASQYTKFGGKVCVITGDETYGSAGEPNIYIGIPKDIEDKLPAIGRDFDIVIYDEVHNLDDEVFGATYERLIKIMGGIPFLALSATVGKPEVLREWLANSTAMDVKYISYSTRFLNLQRHLFTKESKLIKIHPMSCITSETLDKSLSNLPMTPYDCVQLWSALETNIGKDTMESTSVASIFQEDNSRLSLNDAREYERILKDKLLEINKINRAKITGLLAQYNIDDSQSNIENINLYNLFKEIKKIDLTPCIVFQPNTELCKTIFSQLVTYLEKLETLNYPYHYANLEFKQRIFIESIAEKNKFKDSIDLESNGADKKKMDGVNKKQLVEQMLKKKDIELLAKFEVEWQKNYNRQVAEIKANTGLADKVKRIQLANLEKEHLAFQAKPILCYSDIYAKHADFCLNTSSPMTAVKIREIHKMISEKLGHSIDYNNVFMQGLKRGIGIYTKDMPPVYNMIVQTLAQNGQLGFVIADPILSMGINMPFRSTCILGYKDSREFKKSIYLQMIGRSGRRGLDREGHIIYANVDWKNLMAAELEEIKGQEQTVKNYGVLAKCSSDFEGLTNIFINPLRESIGEPIIPNNKFYDDELLNRILWKFREYNDHTRTFISRLVSLEMSFRKAVDTQSIRECASAISQIFFSGDVQFIEYLRQVLINQVLDNTRYVDNGKLFQFAYLVRDLYNILVTDDNQYYQFISKHLKECFKHLKQILITNNLLGN